MTIHALRLQFEDSYFLIFKDLVKLEKLDEYDIPPGSVACDLEAHVALHTATTLQVARLTSPNRTRPLPVKHL